MIKVINRSNEFVGIDEILKVVNELEENDRTIKDIKKILDETEKVKNHFNNYISELDLKYSRTEFPNKWKHLSKELTYPFEYFTSIDDYQ